jgi:DNA-binding transcriptional ArsR family regulator
MAKKTPGPGFDPEQDILLDARSLRGVAHPLRLRLLGSLRNDGPQTATQLAARLGESSAATSYHLRMLATHGFVTEAPELGRGRERFWRAVHRGTWFGTPDQEAPERELADAYLQTVGRMAAENIERWVDERPDWPTEWSDAANLSNLGLRLTAREAEQLGEDLMRVLARYRDEVASESDDGPSRVRFMAQFQIFPRRGQLDTVRAAEDATATPTEEPS